MLALLAHPDADYPDVDTDWKQVNADCILIRWPEVNNAYLTKTEYKIFTSQKSFRTFKLMHCKIYITLLVYLCQIIIILNNYFLKKGNQHSSMQIRQCFACWWGIPVNANEEMLAGYAYPHAGYPDADPDAT